MNGGGDHVFRPLVSISPRLPIWAEQQRPHREAVAGMSSADGRRGVWPTAGARDRAGAVVLLPCRCQLHQPQATPVPCPLSPTPRSFPRLLQRNL